MEQGFYIVSSDMSLRETFIYKTRGAAQKKINQNKTMVGCIVMSRKEYMDYCKSKEYPLEGRVYWRESTKEWVMEVSGFINGVNFGCRHTQSGNLRPDQVPGLPELYDQLEENPGYSFYTQTWEN